MILTMDVGNTNIKTALFDGVEMKKYWRLSTSSTHTSDEYGFLLSGLLERRQNRGMGGAKTQVMLCGIPNVGKSTFSNTFAGSARAKAADRPGVTKGKQWVSSEKFDLLDMPGVLWKKFDSRTIASNLAFIGSIKDDILDVEELAMNLLDEVRRNYPDLVAQRYKLDAETMALPPYELM